MKIIRLEQNEPLANIIRDLVDAFNELWLISKEQEKEIEKIKKKLERLGV